MDVPLRRSLAAVVAVLVVVSAAMVGVGAAGHDDAEREDDTASADEVYVEENGDAVLVYGPDDGDGPERATFGLDVTEGLVYGLFEDPVEGTPDVRGDFSATASPARIDLGGSLSGPRPEYVQNLEFSLSGESTSQRSRSDLTLDATFRDESGWSQLLRSASTDGEVTTTASSFRLTGEFQADSAVPLGADQRVSATLREREETYTVSIERNQTVSQPRADAWEDRATARRTLRARYGGFAEAVDGNASVAIDSLSLTDAGAGSSRLDVAYTVTYRGIDEGLGTAIRAALAEDAGVSADQADRLASELREARIEEASFTYRMENGDPSGEVTLELSEYDGLLLAYFDIASSLEGGMGDAYARNAERYRKQLEARAAADLKQRVTWSGSLTHPDDESVAVDFEYHARSENWQAYVQELEDRDVPRYDTEYELTASTNNDRIGAEGSAELRGEDLFEEFLRGMNSSVPEETELSETVETIRETGPRKAKLETSYDADGFRLEFGAAFEDLVGLRDELADEYDLPPVTEAVARTEESGTVTYVRVSGAVDADATTADVRALSTVDEDTAVHMPGEWDREFPSMDTERASSFLSSDGTGGALPGFGPVAALLAILATALLVGRRR